jgi:hypothetical protein
MVEFIRKGLVNGFSEKQDAKAAQQCRNAKAGA